VPEQVLASASVQEQVLEQELVLTSATELELELVLTSATELELELVLTSATELELEPEPE